MSKRDSFLLRLDPAVLAALRKWAEDELRSTNAHVEFLLRDALKKVGRLPKSDGLQTAEQIATEQTATEQHVPSSDNRRMSDSETTHPDDRENGAKDSTNPCA